MFTVTLFIFVLIILSVLVENRVNANIEFNYEVIWPLVDPKSYNDKAKDFCSDKRTLSVNTKSEYTGLYQLSTTKSLLFAYNGVLFSVIDYIYFKSFLPVVESTVDTGHKKFRYPQYMDKAVENNMRDAYRYNVLTFDDYAFYVKVTNNTVLTYITNLLFLKKNDSNAENTFIGFNQVWFNCPQPLPIDAQIDAIVSRGDYLWFFRGAYYWENAFTLKNTSFRVNNAQHVSVWDNRLPSHLDASFTDEASIIFIFKGSQYMTYNGKMSVRTHLKPVRTLFGDKFPHYIDAAFYNSNSMRAYIFKGDQYWIYDMTVKDTPKLVDGYPRHVKSLNKHFPTNLNTATVIKSEIYIFKGWKFINFSIDLLNGSLHMISLHYKHIFTDFFKLMPQMYTQEFAMSYQELLNKYGKHIQYDTVLADESSELTHSRTPDNNTDALTNAKDKPNDINKDKDNQSNQKKNNKWILYVIIVSVIIVIVVIIAVIAYFVVRKRNASKRNKEGNISTNKVITAAGNKKLNKEENTGGSLLLWKASSSTAETSSAKSFKIDTLKNKEMAAAGTHISVHQAKTTV